MLASADAPTCVRRGFVSKTAPGCVPVPLSALPPALVISCWTTADQKLDRVLRRRGLAMNVVTHPKDAHLRLTQPRHSIVLIVLPFRDGCPFELTRRVKSQPDPDLAAIPVLLLASTLREGDVIRGLESGADDVLTRERLSDRVLAARVASLLRRWYDEVGWQGVDAHDARLCNSSLPSRPTRTQEVNVGMDRRHTYSRGVVFPSTTRGAEVHAPLKADAMGQRDTVAPPA